MKHKFLILAIFVILFSSIASAETTCKTENCKTTITIKIAFSGATDDQIVKWAKDINDVWNNGYPTTGDCKCPVTFKVETMKITNASQVNCNPPPEGHHCVMVTPWNGTTESLPFFYNSSGGKEYVVAYMGYNTQSPSKGGASIDGWWSDQVNRPSGNSTYHDAAHEVGHMMGLDDGEGGLMNFTSGENSKPTQDNIDSAVKNVCGDNTCPDRCCCGNGIIEDKKGEKCDPFAEPVGCQKGQACCIICCSCYGPVCDPTKGQYLNQQQCDAGCTGKCYYNYKTGCWDCLQQEIETHGIEGYDPEVRFECSHIDMSSLIGIKPLEDMPFNGIFADKRINIYIDDGTMGSIVMSDGVIMEACMAGVEDPTMNMFASAETVDMLVSGETTLLECFENNDITYEGIGIINSIQLFIADTALAVYSFFT